MEHPLLTHQHSLGLGVVLSPDPLELVQVMGPEDGPVPCQVVKVVHDDSHEEVNDLRAEEQTQLGERQHENMGRCVLEQKGLGISWNQRMLSESLPMQRGTSCSSRPCERARTSAPCPSPPLPRPTQTHLEGSTQRLWEETKRAFWVPQECSASSQHGWVAGLGVMSPGGAAGSPHETHG